MPTAIKCNCDVYRFYHNERRRCRYLILCIGKRKKKKLLVISEISQIAIDESSARKKLHFFFLWAEVEEKRKFSFFFPQKNQQPGNKSFCCTSLSSLLSDLSQFRLKVACNVKKKKKQLASLSLSCQPPIKMQTPTPK